MNDALVLRQEGTPRRCVWHRPVDSHGDGYVYVLEVELEDDGLNARGRSALDGREGEDLPTFLGRLLDQWRGWCGVLTWTSMDGEMTAEATHDGRHVMLAVTLRRPKRSYESDAWSARVVFSLEPGEQLRELPRGAAGVLTRE